MALATVVAQHVLLSVVYEAMLRLPLEFVRRILAAPLRALEQAGEHRLLGVLTEDVATITSGLMQVPLFDYITGTISQLLFALAVVVINGALYGIAVGSLITLVQRVRHSAD